MKRKDFVAEIKALSASDLKLRAKTLSEELMKLRFRKSTGQLEQGYRLGQLKRDLARVQTIMNASRAAK